MSEGGTVLLKNANSTLPINGQAKRIAVIGQAASQQGAEESYNTGSSAHIPEAGPHPHVVAPITGITQRASADGDIVTFSDGSSQADAVAAAAASDVAVVFVGDGESEGVDRPDLTLSNANRMAAVGLFKTLANEVAGDGITVNTVAPGRFATDRLASNWGSWEEMERSAAEGIPAGRLGQPDEFGDLVAFLCSDRAAYLTGTVIALDGGLLRSV